MIKTPLNDLPKDLLCVFITVTNAKVVLALLASNRIISATCLVPHFKRQLQESHTTYETTIGTVTAFNGVVIDSKCSVGYWPNDCFVYKQEWITEGVYKGIMTTYYRIIDYQQHISLCEVFYENGSPTERSFSKNGKLHGPLLKWYWIDRSVDTPYVAPLLYRVTYNNGRKEGLDETFYLDGSLSAVTHWLNGIREGPRILYASDGSVLSRIVYKQGISETLIGLQLTL